MSCFHINQTCVLIVASLFTVFQEGEKLEGGRHKGLEQGRLQLQRESHAHVTSPLLTHGTGWIAGYLSSA